MIRSPRRSSRQVSRINKEEHALQGNPAFSRSCSDSFQGSALRCYLVDEAPSLRQSMWLTCWPLIRCRWPWPIKDLLALIGTNPAGCITRKDGNKGGDARAVLKRDQWVNRAGSGGIFPIWLSSRELDRSTVALCNEVELKRTRSPGHTNQNEHRNLGAPYSVREGERRVTKKKVTRPCFVVDLLDGLPLMGCRPRFDSRANTWNGALF